MRPIISLPSAVEPVQQDGPRWSAVFLGLGLTFVTTSDGLLYNLLREASYE